jgi:hypothetical protein
MESINVNADIKTFIQSNSSNSLPPYKFEFIPYSPEIDNIHKEYPIDVVNSVKNFISNVFFAEPPEMEVNSYIYQ